MKRGIVRLHNSVLSDIIRLWFGGQPHCSLWHSSSAWAKSDKKTDSGKGDGSSSSSSDSDSDKEEGPGVDKELKEAVKGVAQAIPGHGSKVQSDLLQQLQSFTKLSEDQSSRKSSPKTAPDLSNLFSGMKIEKHSPRTKTESRYSQDGRPPRQDMALRQHPSQIHREKVKLFDGPSLGIFTAADAAAKVPASDVAQAQRVSLWERVEQEQLDMIRRMPPTNAFEEMIEWTRQGKLWHFPINNEQGLDEEAKVGFHKHVFLEDQIQDFPQRGPLRHFIELVVIGLSKNPFLTVQQKHEHIDWFRQYFNKNQDILKEALGEDGLISSSEAN